jgi:hypothetical protein
MSSGDDAAPPDAVDMDVLPRPRGSRTAAPRWPPLMIVTVAVAAATIAGSAVVGLSRRQHRVNFCATYGTILGTEPQLVGGHLLYVGVPATQRDPCHGDDLWHMRMDASVFAQAEGVLFDDCVISWNRGGRTSAKKAGVPCTPHDSR